jgi:hypothetical protein
MEQTPNGQAVSVQAWFCTETRSGEELTAFKRFSRFCNSRIQIVLGVGD